MKKIPSLLLLIAMATYSNAQSLTPSVVSSAGGEPIVASGSLEWTLGEIVTETFRQKKEFLTQGFHQPATITITNIRETLDPEFSIYPNPTRQFLHVKMATQCECEIRMFDLNGKELLNINGSFNTENDADINVEHLTATFYLIHVRNIKTGSSSYFKIEKH